MKYQNVSQDKCMGTGQTEFTHHKAESWGDYIPDSAGGADAVNTSGGFLLPKMEMYIIL